MQWSSVRMNYPVIWILLVGIFAHVVQGRLRHCYICRSRGELGDCKDPFTYNATMIEDVKGVEATPCASGWCAKIIEGENDEIDTATERMCVQRPPTDGEERCSDTIIDRKRVYMCFCHGNLCNAAPKTLGTSYLLTASFAMATLVVNWAHLFY